MPPPHLIHPARSLAEASALLFPLIHDLGWNRAPADGPMHFHAARNGATWLLVTPLNADPGESDSNVTSSQDASPTPVPTQDAIPPQAPQGCIIALPYANSTGWIGFFVLRAEHRGLGLGGALWAAMERVWAREGTGAIGLDAVKEQVATYRRRGFVEHVEIPVLACSLDEAVRVAGGTSSSLSLGKEEGGGGDVEFRDLSTIPAPHIASLDLALTGLDRSTYWLSDSPTTLLSRCTTGLACYTGATLTGLIVLRACDNGYRIGPLYAPDPETAGRLLRAAVRRLGEQGSVGGQGGSGKETIEVEVFGGNKDAQRVFEDAGWKSVGAEYTRMWRGRVPEAQRGGGQGTKRMFAIFDAGCG